MNNLKTKKIQLLLLLMVGIFAISSCSNDDDSAAGDEEVAGLHSAISRYIEFNDNVSAYEIGVEEDSVAQYLASVLTLGDAINKGSYTLPDNRGTITCYCNPSVDVYYTIIYNIDKIATKQINIVYKSRIDESNVSARYLCYYCGSLYNDRCPSLCASCSKANFLMYSFVSIP